MEWVNADRTDSFYHIENNDYTTVSTNERVPSRNSERSKPVKKKRSTSSLRNPRDSPIPGLSALTPIHKRWNRVSSADRQHADGGNFKSSIRKITHISVNSRSRRSQSSTSEDDAELITQESSSIISVPTVEVQIPNTAIGSLDYQTFDDPKANDRHHESSELATVSVNKPGSSPEVTRMRSKKPSHTRKTQSISSSKTTSNSLDPSDRELIINRSRPNSRSSLYSYSEKHSTAKKPYDSDETLCNQGHLENGENKNSERSTSLPVGPIEQRLAIKANSNGKTLEENFNSLAIAGRPALTQGNSDRALLPSQRSQFAVHDIPNELGPMTCRGALHSFSCEHLNTGFRSMETAFTKTNSDIPIIANKLSANAKDQENLQAETELQPVSLFTPESQKSPQPPGTGSTACDEQTQQSCTQCKIAILREKVNNESKKNESKQAKAHQLPRYDDWEESPVEESYNYQQCDPNEFF